MKNKWFFAGLGLVTLIAFAFKSNTPPDQQLASATRAEAPISRPPPVARVVETAPAPAPTPEVAPAPQKIASGLENVETPPSSSLLTAKAGEIVRVPSREISVQTHKWDGRIIETTASCFYADINEFRCIAEGRGRVDFTDLEPAAARADIEKNCDTTDKVAKSRCKVTLRFVYDSFEQMDTGGVFGHITIVKAKDDFGAVILPGKKKR